MSLFKEQYHFVKDSRSVLFDYCGTISNDDLTRSEEAFGRGGSIRNLLVHIANTYEFWIGQNVLKMDIVYPEYESVKTISEIKTLFNKIDLMMQELFDKLPELEDRKINCNIRGVESETDVSRIFTHVITHEFHHKGQILTLSRRLGYTPVDTDIMR